MIEYNTKRNKLIIREYGRNIQKLVEECVKIEDREKRTQTAYAIVRIMSDVVNSKENSTEVGRNNDDFWNKLWDHLYIMSEYQLDVDSPYPCPVAETFNSDPVPIPMKGSKIRAFHYGRNIESIINLLCEQPDGEVKTEMIRSLAIYMRTQYLIWNKDSVADETIFADIEKMSDYRLRVPEGLSLSKIAGDANFSRPGMGINVGQPGSGQRKRKNNYKRPFKKK